VSKTGKEGKQIKAQITIHLDIPDVKVLNVEINNRGDCTISVESTIEGTKCRKCGREITDFHSLDDWITLRHLPILGSRVYIRLRPKRYRCPYCDGGPTTTQQLDWYAPRSPHTKAYEQYLLLQLVNSTIEDVAIKEDIGYKAVEAIVDRWISRTVNWDEIKKVQVLGLDEIALKKGHRDFVVIVTARLTNGEVLVLAVLPDRKKQTVKRFLQGIPARLQRRVETVCTDIYDGFINAVKEVLVKARVVIDRYHVARMYRDGVDQLRKQEIRRLKQELSREEYETIKGAMWAFRKNQASLEVEEEELLKRLFSYSPELKRAYTLREALTAIFEREISKEEATRQIKSWRKRVKASGLRCFDNFLTTLLNWMEEITNYFVNRDNSGFVEGFNNKIKVIKRRCYGIFNIAHLFQRIFLDLEGYRLFARTVC
jgi:transposase